MNVKQLTSGASILSDLFPASIRPKRIRGGGAAPAPAKNPFWPARRNTYPTLCQSQRPQRKSPPQIRPNLYFCGNRRRLNKRPVFAFDNKITNFAN
ncbi:hypothetical protein [uncultured Alistipes sp.]|jgi:hypothetical protein|uniref:hypothetical protein n=1 Tax=uncultured Alistipes sp. TaxID=538949 RepID=UPI0025F8E396|nr:hypothetical protein [uncultured Alistipes sp.]